MSNFSNLDIMIMKSMLSRLAGLRILAAHYKGSVGSNNPYEVEIHRITHEAIKSILRGYEEKEEKEDDLFAIPIKSALEEIEITFPKVPVKGTAEWVAYHPTCDDIYGTGDTRKDAYENALTNAYRDHMPLRYTGRDYGINEALINTGEEDHHDTDLSI